MNVYECVYHVYECVYRVYECVYHLCVYRVYEFVYHVCITCVSCVYECVYRVYECVYRVYECVYRVYEFVYHVCITCVSCVYECVYHVCMNVCIVCVFPPVGVSCGSDPVRLQYLQGGRGCFHLGFSALLSSSERDEDEEEEEEGGTPGSPLHTSVSLRSGGSSHSALRKPDPQPGGNERQRPVQSGWGVQEEEEEVQEEEVQ